MSAKVPPGLASAPNVGQWFLALGGDRLLVRTGRAELGQGVSTALLQMAAVELDLPPDRPEIRGPDTRDGSDEGFASGGHTACTHGRPKKSSTMSGSATKRCVSSPESSDSNKIPSFTSRRFASSIANTLPVLSRSHATARTSFFALAFHSWRKK